ncbi:ribonuclease H-like domain-containing protein, partial [Favolaschia claudopus]
DSPSKNTRSQTKIARDDVPVVQSPPKPRKAKDKDVEKTDKAVWHLTDDEIIAASRKSWKSAVYDHYTVSLERQLDKDSNPHCLIFLFTCRFDPKNHNVQRRKRIQNSQGTSNLARTMKTCCESRKVEVGADSSKGAQQDLHRSVSRYTPAHHRALIALRCAASHRPFNSVTDPLYLEEVELLRPGTNVPSPSTVSRDVRALYEEGSKQVKEYFRDYEGAIHCVVDGWTAPIVASYLGVVIIWFSLGKIHRTILEFIRLKERHTGEYLAEQIAKCFKRFGIDHLLHTLCMDNASNCDSTATSLADDANIPTYRGALSRTRCFPHTVNLIAKAFLSFFFKQPKKKPQPKATAGSKRKRTTATTTTTPAGPTPVPAETSLVPEEADEPVVADVELDEAGVMDEGKAEFDASAIKTVKARAVALAESKWFLHMSKEEETEALLLFPKVAGLARRVHDSSTLQEKFEKLVQANDSASGKVALDRRVPTRWNSDLVCLAAHIQFETPVKQLTSDGLSEYALTPKQWALAKELCEVLVIFEELTRLFSRAEVPLVYEVIPMLEDLEAQLTNISQDASLHTVTRIAALAALEIVGKYYALTDDCEVYRIAIVMCPDKKMEWFNRNDGWVEADRKEADRIVRLRWSESYAPKVSPTTQATVDAPAPPAKVCKSILLIQALHIVFTVIRSIDGPANVRRRRE